MELYNVLLLVVACVVLVEGNLFIIRKDRIYGCEYKGYVPGGNVKDVGKMKFPVAKMAKSGIASVLGPVSQASTLGMHSLNTIKAITGAFKDIAPTLGPCLGVFGAVTGIYKSLTAPKPSDILTAVNDAMGTLTKDMNDKIQRMEGYVDSQIVTVEKNLIQREYQTCFNLWTACVEEATPELSNECQREAYATLSANRPKFAVFASKLMKWDKKQPYEPISGFESRELEAYLVPFRDYANLILMMLKPLIQTYAKDNSAAGKRHFQRFSKAMKAQSEFFQKYAWNSVIAILHAHRGTKRAGVCPKTLDCGPIKTLKEGFIPVHTANTARCNCVIEDGTKELCQIEMTFRKDGKRPYNYYRYQYSNCYTDAQGAKEFAGRFLVPLAKKYQKKNWKVVLAYWKQEILQFRPVWKKAATEVAKAAVGDETYDDEFADVVADEFADDVKFSARYAGRLSEAERKAREHVIE